MVSALANVYHKTPRDPGARAREAYLSLVSDPDKRVVAFPNAVAQRPRSRLIDFDPSQLMPAPQRTRTMDSMPRRRHVSAERPSLSAFGITALGALVIGLLIGETTQQMEPTPPTSPNTVTTAEITTLMGPVKG